jgi:predicted nucleotidyltransferase component of viral defense system
MITKQEILDLSQEWQLRPGIVEKDYTIGWLLWGIGNNPRLRDSWVFKGGTCLKKCFIETYRFSEDLDFTVLPDGPVQAFEVSRILPDLLQFVTDSSGINFSIQQPKLKDRPNGHSTEVRVYYQGPLQARTPASVKFDLTKNEDVIQPPVLRATAHPYSDEFPESTENNVRCYGLEEVFAEKIRALGERCRPRDLYDVIMLYWRPDLQLAPHLILSVLERKCKSKQIAVPTYESMVNSPFFDELKAEWGNMLAHQLPVLPPIESFLGELENVFKWLCGDLKPTILEAISVDEKEIDTQWTPPSTVWKWGQGVPLEAVRFAGANRLCIDLTYNGTVRRIEPYSLRRTSIGHILLYARKSETGEIRAYRIDRIQGIKVATLPFVPIYKVEFTPTGPISSPKLTRRPSRLVEWYSTGRSGPRQRISSRIGPTYIIECPYCNKKFRRSKHNFTLNKHKDQSGYSICLGSGRKGYLVDTIY